MRKSIVAAVIAASASTSACGHSREEDGGAMSARNFPVGVFTEIEAAGPYDVTVRTGSAPSVSAKGPQKVLEHMVVEVDGGKLSIHPEKQNGWFHHGTNYRGKVELVVTVPSLTAATLAGAGDIRARAGARARRTARIAHPVALAHLALRRIARRDLRDDREVHRMGRQAVSRRRDRRQRDHDP